MKLLVEIGNTSLNWCRLDGGQLGEMTAARHYGSLPIDVLASWEQLAGITGVLVASVGPESVVEAVRATAAAYWQCPFSRIETQAQVQGVKIAYADAARLGVDRFLAMIGAYWLDVRQGLAIGADAEAQQPAATEPEPRRPTLVVDAGTAITFDALLADGRHLGGQILPGLSMLRQSLLHNTQLPSHETQDHTDSWASDTGPAIAAASLQAPVALAERLLQRLQQDSGTMPRLILTGGDAERIAPLFRESYECQPALVLKGLARFA